MRRVMGCLLFLSCLVQAEHKTIVPAEAIPSVRLPLMRNTPTLDGNIEAEEWSGACRNVGFLALRGNELTSRDAAFRIGCDGTSLFIAVRSELPPDGKILNRAVPHPRRDIKAAFADDSIELVIDPKRGRTTGDRTFYHIITNGRMALFDQAINPDDPRNPIDLGWRVQGMQLRQGIHDGWWDVEIAIPLAPLGVTAADFSRPWGLRVARNWRRPGAQSQWGPSPPSYEDQPSMPLVQWDAAAPVVHVLSLQENWQRVHVAVSVRNPGPRPLVARVRLTDAWHFNPPSRLEQRLELPPGAKRILTLDAPDGGPAGIHDTRILVTTKDGLPFYRRRVHWSLHRPPPEKRWNLGETARRAVDLQFKYYPYHRRIRLRVDLTHLPDNNRITGLEARIVPIAGAGAKDSTVLWSGRPILHGRVAEDIFEIPDLADGSYRLEVFLRGKGAPEQPLRQEFVRRHFVWEHNQLGKTTEVMPPFTPLKVDQTRVACVLREHTHTDTGLWEQVRSAGRDLLAAPMFWTVETDTGSQPVRGSGWACIEATANRVVGEASWKAGPATATTRTEYDVDGMMLITLRLAPHAGRILKDLSLVIPLNESVCRYMHACGDGLRHNFAGFVPPGQGRVWDSSKGNKLEIPDTFYPYVWLGDGRRGLCWFADTDRDWVLDDTTPTLDLTRRGNRLELRVHFITRPAPLDRPRRIVFGLQVTPTKPMPQGWRRWLADKEAPGGRPVGWMGANFYWGAHAYDVYPHEKRFEYYEALARARRTGKTNPDFIRDWMAMLETTYPNDGRPYSARGYEFYRAHVVSGHHRAAAATWKKGWRLFGYTNARGVGFHAPEFATFQDEWLRYGWFRRDWDPNGAVGYDLSPSESFVDYAVWYYRKMVRTWADGIYWDNTFLNADYDPVVGNAWTDDQGTVHPGMGLFHLRNLIKRTAIMLWQEGRHADPNRLPFITLSHMTNTMIVPVLSFGNCTMDWEWKYGYADFQDRFSPDLTVAETIGRQVGSWPTILAGGHPDPKDPRTRHVWRTRLGVCLVHEIQTFDYRPASDAELYAKLFAFGYGSPKCRVFPYWETPHPVSVAGIDARTLAMTNRGKAVIIVTNYGPAGEAKVTLDLAALQLDTALHATDFETGAPIAMPRPDTLRFHLDTHDVRLVRLAP